MKRQVSVFVVLLMLVGIARADGPMELQVLHDEAYGACYTAQETVYQISSYLYDCQNIQWEIASMGVPTDGPEMTTAQGWMDSAETVHDAQEAVLNGLNSTWAAADQNFETALEYWNSEDPSQAAPYAAAATTGYTNILNTSTAAQTAANAGVLDAWAAYELLYLVQDAVYGAVYARDEAS